VVGEYNLAAKFIVGEYDLTYNKLFDLIRSGAEYYDDKGGNITILYRTTLSMIQKHSPEEKEICEKPIIQAKLYFLDSIIINSN